MSKQVVLVIDSGSITYLEHDTREPLMQGGKTRRASWVVPQKLLKRLLWILIRKVVGDHGRIADWCRSWRGPWLVDLRVSGGPVVGGFSCRESALEYEENWVLSNLGE